MSSKIISLPKNLLYKIKLASDLFPVLNTAKRGDLKYDSVSQALLIHHGLIHHANHGSYAILPLLNRSLKKLRALIEEEMNYIGAQEILMPCLVSKSLWRKSGRLDQNEAMRDIYALIDRRKKEYLLGPTHEEGVTKLVSDFKISHNRLPLMLYQIASKFRDEPRAKHGLMRTTEFIMKDLYTFDESVDQAKCTYEKVGDAYARILNTLGLKYTKTISSVGNIGGIFSHEYQLLAPSGEDTILVCNDCKVAWNQEYLSEEEASGNMCDRCRGANLISCKGVEVGHTFLLSTTYSKPMEAMFFTKQGTPLPLQMGCFGLGLTRILAASVETLSVRANDGGHFQIRWPNTLAPFKVCVISPKEGSTSDTPEVMSFIKDSVKSMVGIEGTDVMLDDRSLLSIGRRLTDIKSLGIPNIIVISREFMNSRKIELHRLNEDKVTYSEESLQINGLLDDIICMLSA